MHTHEAQVVPSKETVGLGRETEGQACHSPVKFVFLPAGVIISVLALHFLPWDSHYVFFFIKRIGRILTR